MDRMEYYLNNPKDFIIKKHSKKDLYLVKYLHSGIDWSNPYALEARGIVIGGKGNIVSRPYEKFFNYLEFQSREDLSEEVKHMSYWEPDEDYDVFEKLDGSLAVVSQYKGELIYSSSGSLEGKYPDKFKNWIENNLNQKEMERLKELTKSYTLMFEYTSPTNRIVIPYQEEKMILHGVVCTRSGEDVSTPHMLELVANHIGVDTVKNLYLNLDDLKEIQKQEFGENLIEGFVIRFDNGKRLKIKTEEYMEVHRTSALGFGELYTKNNVLMIVEQLDDDVIDDTVAFFEQRNDVGVLTFIDDVKSCYNLFKSLEKKADRIYSNDDFSPKRYALDFGTDSTLDKLVLNQGRKENAVKKLKDKYILKNILNR